MVKCKVTVESGAGKAWETVEAEHAVWAGAALIEHLSGGSVTYEVDGEVVQPNELPPQKFAHFAIKRGTCPAYFPDSSDVITLGEIIIDRGVPVDGGGMPLKPDYITRKLVGYKHGICASYNDGAVLVPLRAAW